MNDIDGIRRFGRSEYAAEGGAQYVCGDKGMAFLRERLGAELFERIMSHEEARRYPYVAAKIYLTAADWERYVKIREDGAAQGRGELADVLR